MTWSEFIKDYAANLLTALTLCVLAYQVWSTNRQFRVLNKGYIQMEPQILTLRSDHGVNGRPEDFTPNMPVQALQCEAILQNVGNLPLWYQVMRYEVSFGAQPITPPGTQVKHKPDVIYPKQKLNFRIPTIQLPGAPILYSSIEGVPIRISLRIEYKGSGADELCTFERVILFTFSGKTFDFRWLEIRDKW